MTPTERLAFLADALEHNATDPKGMKFDLGCWLKSNVDATRFPNFSRDCGTTGCAVGLAMLLPVFKAEGLNHTNGMREPYFNGAYGFSAVAMFFGISNMQAERLFHPTFYQDLDVHTGAKAELTVAKRIRDFIVAQNEF